MHRLRRQLHRFLRVRSDAGVHHQQHARLGRDCPGRDSSRSLDRGQGGDLAALLRSTYGRDRSTHASALGCGDSDRDRLRERSRRAGRRDPRGDGQGIPAITGGIANSGHSARDSGWIRDRRARP